MKTLRLFTTKLADLFTEARKLNTLEATAKQDLDKFLKTGNADLEDPKTLQRVTQCQAHIALAGPRRRKIAELIDGCVAQVSQFRARESSRFAQFVQKKRQERFDEFIATILPYWDHSARAARRRFETEHIPYVEELNACRFDQYDPEMTPEKELDFAQSFIAHVERCSKKFGWTEFE